MAVGLRLPRKAGQAVKPSCRPAVQHTACLDPLVIVFWLFAIITVCMHA